MSKSNHKHEYEPVILRRSYDFMGKLECYSLGKICNECGKTKITYYFDTDKTDDGCIRILCDEELLEKYKDYRIIDYAE